MLWSGGGGGGGGGVGGGGGFHGSGRHMSVSSFLCCYFSGGCRVYDCYDYCVDCCSQMTCYYCLSYRADFRTYSWRGQKDCCCFHFCRCQDDLVLNWGVAALRTPRGPVRGLGLRAWNLPESRVLDIRSVSCGLLKAALLNEGLLCRPCLIGKCQSV